MNYEIAIPSYKRPDRVVSETLTTLQRHGADMTRVTVFTANEEETADYEKAIYGAGFDEVTVAQGVLGIANQRIFISGKYYDKGTRVVSLDDDVSKIQLTDGKKLYDFEGDFDTIVQKGFEVCDESGARIWGINPCANGFFMKNTITVGLRYICAIFYGFYAGDEAINGADRGTESSGEDYEATLRSFVENGSVVRFDGITVKTKYFAAGGIQAQLGGDAKNRYEDHARVLESIVAKYPDLSKTYEKAGGVTNIKLKVVTKSKIDYVPQ